MEPDTGKVYIQILCNILAYFNGGFHHAKSFSGIMRCCKPARFNCKYIRIGRPPLPFDVNFNGPSGQESAYYNLSRCEILLSQIRRLPESANKFEAQ